MVKDATADDSDEEMHAALDINLANYAVQPCIVAVKVRAPGGYSDDIRR